MQHNKILLRAVGAALPSLLAVAAAAGWAQTEPNPPSRNRIEGAQSEPRTTDDYNRRLTQLDRMLAPHLSELRAEEYRVGPEDLLEINVFEAPEMNRALRVAAGGEISLPLLGVVHAAGLTPRELEFVLQELLRHSYIKDPHVGVFVREMQSHAVSVFGAVRKPGVYQIRGARSLVEV